MFDEVFFASQILLKKCFYRCFKKREQFMDCRGIKQNKERFFKPQLYFMDAVYFFYIVYRDNLSAITKYITKAISIIGNKVSPIAIADKLS